MVLGIVPIVPKRRRRPVQKSFSGCDRCKARKIKCDEMRPSCAQCKTKGLVCPGYPTHPKLRWSRKHEVLEHKQPGLLNLPLKAQNLDAQNLSASGSSFSWSRGFGSPHGSDDTGLIYVSDRSTSTGDKYSFDEASHITSWQKQLTVGSSNSCCQTSLSLDDMGPLIDDQSDITLSPHLLATEIHDLSPGIVSRQTMLQQMLFSPNQGQPLDARDEGAGPSIEIQPPPCNSTTSTGVHWAQKAENGHLTTRLIDLPSELVTIYFRLVCPIFSTFDSEHNLFRTFVTERWQNSGSLFYAIQSMAAAKISRVLPRMRVCALDYRSLAFTSLSSQISRASAWDIELLFTVLMLGISSCWYDISDLGLVHLEAVQRAVLHNNINPSDGFKSVEFFKKALVYWEMVSCVVNDNVVLHDYSVVECEQAEGQGRYLCQTVRAAPHPWTGVSSEPQALFSRIARHIRRVHSFDPRPRSSASILEESADSLDAITSLDETVWACSLPSLHDIISTGDGNTPVIHHLLLAEAYMFANLYQLYYIFPSLRRRRAKYIIEATNSHSSKKPSWAESQVHLWIPILQQFEGTEKWLRFLGRSIILRLEQIQESSRTSCVQALLLLVAAGSLWSCPDWEGSEAETELVEARQFVLNRLSFISESNLSPPVEHVRTVVLEIFKRLDVGVDVFWMDVLQSMGVLTIIG